MPNAKLKNYLHLHFLVFIAGFTAILGELISIGSLELVWYRMSIAGILMYLYIRFVGISLKVPKKVIVQFSVAGIIIALHWITFFEAINQANISIALAMFSTGAFFASFVEPIFFKRSILGYEMVFGFIVIIGVVLITSSEIEYLYGIVLGLLSAFFSTLFAVINGRFILKHKASVISFYEFVSGVIFLTVFLLLMGKSFDSSFFALPKSDWIYLFILASICTAYAFIGAVEVMRYISPFTVILSYNLEPVYGIALALILFPESEVMSLEFYLGALLVLSTVILDAYLKNRQTAINKRKILKD
ncbi:DMT family transporter [Winogradskyella sp. DF17]|uniref:DMT family transporter n=1 Tax=Winogradskyella pelagia TaxID=2819984 RepID=A0ABS3T532_9FLAO|nr:DMT family transporter [Winogradskyella sp. DF17]MBO3117857.1 DMT family transporter [Winogradskyella sp. DF17]